MTEVETCHNDMLQWFGAVSALHVLQYSDSTGWTTGMRSDP